MPYNQNDQNYSTTNSRVMSFDNFKSNKQKEKEELKSLKRSTVDFNDETNQVIGNKKYKFNRVTKKMDELSPEEIEDNIENIDEDFIYESYLINESNIMYSTNFRKLLKDIDSPISSYLSEIENKDFDVSNNYFDISTDSKETITFIADRRAKEIIKGDGKKIATVVSSTTMTHNINANGKIFNELGYKPVGEKSYQPEDGEKGEVVSRTIAPSGNVYVYMKFEDGECVIKEDRISYDDRSKEVWVRNRQPVRVGRGIRSLVTSTKKEFSAAEYEDFVNKYKAAYDKMNDIYRNFELVKGNDIAKWYKYENYKEGTNRGTLGNSCMAEVPSSYFQIYVENPEVCSLLILKDEDNPNKIKARALVWNIKSTSDITFVDRIYTHNDSDVQLFRNYAKLKGWYCKKYNDSSSTTTCISPVDSSDVTFPDFVVPVKKSSYDRYPYVDTIKYFDRDAKTISTCGEGDTICLESTGGGYEGAECDNCGGSGMVQCYDCNGRGNEYCNDCDGDGTVSCSNCDGDKVVDCDSCDGSGCENCDGGKMDCPDCDGRGTEDCFNCDGRGRVDCSSCDGEGEVNCGECN